MLNKPFSKRRLFHAQLPIGGPLCAWTWNHDF